MHNSRSTRSTEPIATDRFSMRSRSSGESDETVLPKGIQRIRHLPDPELGVLWDSIVVDDALKSRLVSQAMLNFTVRGKIDRSVLPLHGAILFIGPPGTGKTSLAKGLAHRTAESFHSGDFLLVEVEPHGLTSSAMGKTQRAVSDLFSQSLAEVAARGPTIVLLDEVETLAADRSRMSLEANPIDIHRATDAVLVQLDALADRHPNLLFLATSNFPQAVDTAFTSRCDLIVDVPLPDRNGCARILKSCLTGLERTYPEIGRLSSSARLEDCVDECVGLDGRAIRKMVATALASSPHTAMNPERLTLQDLLSAAKAAKKSRIRSLDGKSSL